MNVIVDFSARENGNCASLAKYCSDENDSVFAMRELPIHPCANCRYECMSGGCIYRGSDPLYSLFDAMVSAEKVIWLIPMYCGCPASSFFILNERSQDYWMRHEEFYNAFVGKLYMIAVYGSAEESPGYIERLADLFQSGERKPHVLGLERHTYHHTLSDLLTSEPDVLKTVSAFLAPPAS